MEKLMNPILTKKLLNSTLLSLLLSLSTSSHAFPKTDVDFMMLPPYCAARHDRTNQNTVDYWQSLIGRADWIHLHHYCSTLHRLNKSRLLPTKQRNITLERFIKNPDYMEKHGTKNFIFLPELYTLRGESMITLGRPKESIPYFQQAIEKNPNYPRSYKELSKVYESLGKRQEAIDIIKQGLKQRPNSKMLTNRLKKLNK